MITRSKLEKISSKVRKGKDLSTDDIQVIQEWRKLHNDLIYGWQSILKSRISTHNLKKKTTVARRLKRLPTIIDKLSRNSSNLSTMHDIAGCRIIFSSLEDLNNFRNEIHKNSKFQYKLISSEKYDYIKNPKNDGYRGIHDVYVYTGDRLYDKGLLGRNLELKIEIQYRTYNQHIWATTVETLGSLTQRNIKFKTADEDTVEYFKCCSEILSRANEGLYSCLKDYSTAQLIIQYIILEARTGIFKRLSLYKHGVALLNKYTEKKFYILSLNTEKSAEKPKLEVQSFSKSADAIYHYNLIEKKVIENQFIDAVMVSTDLKKDLKKLFPNYFLKTKDFSEALVASILLITTNAINVEYKNTLIRKYFFIFIRWLITNHQFTLQRLSGIMKLRK